MVQETTNGISVTIIASTDRGETLYNWAEVGVVVIIE